MCKVANCLKRYTDPSSLRKHVKTFKHDNLSSNQNKHIIGKSDESMDDDLTAASDKPLAQVYFGNLGLKEHLESNDEAIYWVRRRDEVTDGIETFKIDQPLDLSIRQKRW